MDAHTLIIAVLGVMVVLFLTGWAPVDLVSCAGLVVLTALGVIEPQAAFSGFGSEVVVTMFAMFIVATSIAAGLLISSALVSPRRSL